MKDSVKVEKWNQHEIRFVWHNDEWQAVSKDTAESLGCVVHLGNNRYITVDELKAKVNVQTVEDLAKKGEFIVDELKVASDYSFALTDKGRLLLISNWWDEESNAVIPNMVREVQLLLDDEKLGEEFRKETIEFIKQSDQGILPISNKIIDRLKKEVSYVEPEPIVEPTPIREKEIGYVYLLRADNGLTKIGKTRSLEQRLDHFTTKLPYELELIGTIESEQYSAIETELHNMFRSKRKRGEWFDLSDEDLENIKKKYNAE